MITPDEAFVMLTNLSRYSKIGFVFKSDEGGHFGEGQIDRLSRNGFSINSSGFLGFVFRLDIEGLQFDTKAPVFLPQDMREKVPMAAHLTEGLLIVFAEGGDSLFLVQLR